MYFRMVKIVCALVEYTMATDRTVSTDSVNYSTQLFLMN